jgi:hypothetical protein
MSGNEGKPCEWAKLDSGKLPFPDLSAKGELDRLLKPDEARACVLVVLRAGGGEVPMETIFKTLSRHVPMMRSGPSLDEPLSGGDGGEGEAGNLHEVLECAQALGAHSLLLDEDAAYLAGNVWELAGQVAKGRSSVVEGQHILCCYYLPKKVYGAKVKLEAFGSSSTVQEVVDALEDILRDWLPTSRAVAHGQALEEWHCMELTRGVIGRLAKYCSENGLCAAFYSAEGLPDGGEGA